MNENHVYDMIIVGGGPGGYTSALYAARAGLETIVLEKLSAGGQMSLTWQIDNYPGFENGIDGFSLAEKMQKQAEKYGAKSEYAEVFNMDLAGKLKRVETSSGIYIGKTVVIATGANPRELGLAKEKELIGHGVAYCASCDGMFYKDKIVVVVGGGNSAVSEIKMERSDVRWQKRRKNRCGKPCTVHIAKDPGYLGRQPMSMGITTWIRRNTCMYAAAILPVIHTLGHTKKVCVPWEPWLTAICVISGSKHTELWMQSGKMVI